MGEPRRVLIVDDDPDIAELVAMCFAHSPDWRSTICTAVRDAVSVAKSTNPDLVLLDWNLGESTAEPVLTELTAQGALQQGAYVLIMSGANISVEPSAFGAAADNVIGAIIKPFDPLSLVSDIEERLAHAHAQARIS